MCASEIVKKDNVAAILSSAMDAGGGILRLAPAWVPRSFLHPGKRIKLAPTDWYALGTHRGGNDERWFARTTEGADEIAESDRGVSHSYFLRMFSAANCALLDRHRNSRSDGASRAATQADRTNPLATTRRVQPRSQRPCDMRAAVPPAPDDCGKGPPTVRAASFPSNGDNGPRGKWDLGILVPTILVLLFVAVAALLSGGTATSTPELAARLAVLVALFRVLCELYQKYRKRPPP